MDHKIKQTTDGRDFLAINPKGSVAALELDDGQVLTEGPATYLFTVLGWCRFFSIDLGRWPSLPAYVQRIGARPAVQVALRAEAMQ